MTFRLLQILRDTADSGANLAALRHHEVLAHNGVEIRTLAIAPGSGRRVSSMVPVMAPSARSIAAFTQLRRELRWPDAVLPVDRLPRAVLGRSEVPVIAVSASGDTRRELFSAAQGRPGVAAIVVPEGDMSDPFASGVAATSHTDGPPTDGHRSSGTIRAERIRTPLGPGQVTSDVTTASRRAAREDLGVPGEGLVAVSIDPVSGRPRRMLVVDQNPMAGSGTGISSVDLRDRPAGSAMVDQFELLVHAVDVVVPEGPVHDGPPDALAPFLVDLMAAGVVPVGWRVDMDDELFSDLGDIVIPAGANGDAIGAPGAAIDAPDGITTAVTARLRTIAAEMAILDPLRTAVTTRTALLCDPDRIRRRWTEILGQALPSQT